MYGELTRRQMERLLSSEVTGHLGCHAAGRTYVVPLTFAYQEGYLYGCTSEGLKIELLRQNPQVCVEVERLDDFANWESVILWGEFQELRGVDAAHALSVLYEQVDRHLAGKTSASLSLSELTDRVLPPDREMVVFRIRVDELTGRFERHPEQPRAAGGGQKTTALTP